jgi:hypothetical protein
VRVSVRLGSIGTGTVPHRYTAASGRGRGEVPADGAGVEGSEARVATEELDRGSLPDPSRSQLSEEICQRPAATTLSVILRATETSCFSGGVLSGRGGVGWARTARGGAGWRQRGG